MHRHLLLTIGLLLAMFPALALSVDFDPSTVKQDVTKSNPVVDFSATVTLETNESAVVVYVKPDSSSDVVGISGKTYITSTGTYEYKLIFPNEPDHYTGKVVFEAIGSDSTAELKYSVHVTAWESKYKDYFGEGEAYTVQVGSDSCRLKVRDVYSDSVTLYFGGDVATIGVGESETFEDCHVKIKVVDVFSNGAVLEFYTTGDPVSVSTKDETRRERETGFVDGEDLSGFHFLISKYSKYIQEGMTYTVTVTLVNDTDYRVDLKDVYFENTTVTDEGEKPTRLEDYQLPSYLDPEQELTLKVTIDTRGLEVGRTYTPTLIALGRVGDRDVRAKVDFYITVVKSVQTGKTEEKEKPSEQPTQPKTPPRTLKNLIIEVDPPTPQPGDYVTIYARDAKTRDFVDATITVNGEPKDSFEAEWCKTYRITAKATGYATATKTVKTKCKNLEVTYSPENPKEGDVVTFTVTDSETGDPVSKASIKVGGRPITGNSWTAKAGVHSVVVTAPGYNQKTFTIRVEKQPVSVLSSIPTTIEPGSELNIVLSREAPWEIYDADGVLVASGNSSTISFTPSEPGKYTIKVNGEEIGTFEVQEPKGLGISFSGNLLWLLAGLGVALVAYDIYRKKKATQQAENQVPVGFDLRPKFATPGEEEEEGVSSK